MVIGPDESTERRTPGILGRRSTVYVDLVFRLPDVQVGSAIYETRWVAPLRPGDDITVYVEDGRWRTTSERSLGGALMFGVGLAVWA